MFCLKKVSFRVDSNDPILSTTALDCGYYKLLVVESGRPSFLNYMFIVFDESTRDAVVVDPGWESGFIVSLLELYRLKCRGILVTHTHADHINEAPDLSLACNCPIYLSSPEARYSGYKHRRLMLFDHGDSIECGSLICKAWVTPGHTQGSSCFYIGQRVFTGDTLFIEGCGLCSGSGGSVDQMFDSIQFLKSSLTDNDHIFPGHKYQLPIGQPFSYLKAKNIYIKMTHKEVFTSFCGRSTRGRNSPPAFDSVKNPHSRLVTF